MEKVTAYDIESCTRCEGLYFPGDELVSTPQGLVHEDCWESTVPQTFSEKNLALRG